MRVKLDENVSNAVAELLRVNGSDVDSVADEGIAGADDAAVLAAASNAGRLVITLDRGFGDLRRHPPGTHAGVLVVRVDDQSPRAVTAAVAQLLTVVELDDLVGCISVWHSGRLRQRRGKRT